MKTPLLDLIKKHRPPEVAARVPEDGFLRLGQLLYELGDLAKCIVRGAWNDNASIYKGEMMLAISDMLLQLRLTCEIYDIDFKECLSLGQVHFEERLQQYKEQYDKTGEWK